MSFIKDGIEQFFDNVYYKNYQDSLSLDGSRAFYSLDIVSQQKLALELPVTGIFFVLNQDYGSSSISSFPITVFWNWKIAKYIRNFRLNKFSFSSEAVFELTIDILKITKEQILDLAIGTFVVSYNSSVMRFYFK